MNTPMSMLLATLCAVGAFATTLPARAADADGAPGAARVVGSMLAPAERFEVGGTLVERHGERGQAIVLIPGLASGAWAWQDTVRQLKDRHVVYVLTFAGFDGRPAVAGKMMAQSQQSVQDLITSRKLAKPVLIGHSLGATLALALAEQHSELIGGVIAIDGLPVFPGTEAMAPEQRQQMADGMLARSKGMTKAMFDEQQLGFMRGMGVIDGELAARLAPLSARSDPAATFQYMAEDLALDLRAGLAAIRVPVLMISPYYAPDAARLNMSEAGKTTYYTSLMAGTPKLTVVSVSPARHFAMFDQPKQVADAIGNYLAALPAQ